MTIEQIYTGCLAQGAYYIESGGEAAVIDPLREVQGYLDRVQADNARIKYIFETHFHADFVSGHLTLAEKTGATIVYGPKADPSFESHIAKDGEVFQVGDITLTALHTPGHTLESTTWLLGDKDGKPRAIFTGDTLFLGDVGRPDLAQQSSGITPETQAGMLYDSLRQKIMPLPDDVTVYPAHGAGSACGKNMSKDTVDTLGNQKKTNYALRADMTRGEFVREVTEGLAPPPAYFPLNVQLNREGYEPIDTVLQKGNRALSPEKFESAANHAGAVVLDVRHKDEYVREHIPRSIFVGLDGGFAPWVGTLIADVQQSILLVTPDGREEEAITRLSRVGFDHTLGYLEGGLEAWKKAGKETDSLHSVPAETLQENSAPVFDVRKPNEYEAGHVAGAVLTPLDNINDHLGDFPAEDFFIHCKSGYRSVIAGSILKSRGIHNAVNVEGGFEAIRKTNVKIE